MNYPTQLFIYDSLKEVWLELFLFDMRTSDHMEFLSNVLCHYNDCPELLIKNGNIHRLSPHKLAAGSWIPSDLKDNSVSYYYRDRADSVTLQEAWRPNISHQPPPILFGKAFVYNFNDNKYWDIVDSNNFKGTNGYFFSYPRIIADFRGIFKFLSNFAEVKIIAEGMVFNSTEAAYQALKTEDLGIRAQFIGLSPKEARKLGQNVPLRKDWDRIKNMVMYAVCEEKFKQEPFKTLLMRTGESILIEENTWGDTYFGVCNGIGENNLGKDLMSIRRRLFAGTI